MNKSYIQVVHKECAWSKVYMGCSFYRVNEPTPQSITHSMTYLEARKMKIDHGLIMGLEHECFTPFEGLEKEVQK